jgi:flagellar basal-body rod protein FlgF/flagellar basal-body rod protein FlgG
MPYGLYLSAAGAQAQSERLEVIANNLANVDTVGFKRELAILQARYAEGIEQGTSSFGSGSRDDISGGVRLAETKTDFSPGPMKRTGEPTDVAIGGDGFFVVRKGQEDFLTRAGNFRLTSGGELVTQQGYPVLSDSRTPVAIPTQGEPWDISSSGTVRQGETAVNLAIVKPGSLGDLVKVGENLFRPLADVQPIPAADRSVLQGHLEMSGVQPTTEMVSLIETSRLAEANLNLMKIQDQMLDNLISGVLKA